jgi:hypothetical protein
MTSYKLFKYVGMNTKKFIGWFSGEGDLINFFNNPKELRHIGINSINDFKSILEVDNFIINECGGILFLEKINQ